MIDYSWLEIALKRLEEQYDNYTGLATRGSLTALDKEAVAESVIQRFETCYDCSWKVLKRYLQEVLGLAEMPNSPKPILRIAAENNLLAKGVAPWLEYAQLRVDTAHDYSGDKAAAALGLIEAFIEDAQALYQKLLN